MKNNIDILSGNKLIADFMGYEYISYNNGNNPPYGWWKKNLPIRNPIIPKSTLGRKHIDLKYHCSWDWLMSVIQKIRKLDSENIKGYVNSSLKIKQNYTKIKKYIQEKTNFLQKSIYLYMKNKLIKIMEEKNMKVVRVNKTEYELENGDVYPHVFELDEDITVEEFQNLLDESKSLVLSHIKNIEEDNE